METIENGFGGWVHDRVPASRLTGYRSSFKVIHWPPKYLTEGHFWPSVCLFVCEQDNSKTDRWILIKFSGYVQNGKRKIWLNFGSDPDHSLDLLDPWNLIFKDRYLKKLRMDCDDIFRKWPKWYKEQVITFLEWSGSLFGSSGSRLLHNFRMNFDDIFRICYKW